MREVTHRWNYSGIQCEFMPFTITTNTGRTVIEQRPCAYIADVKAHIFSHLEGLARYNWKIVKIHIYKIKHACAILLDSTC